MTSDSLSLGGIAIGGRSERLIPHMSILDHTMSKERSCVTEPLRASEALIRGVAQSRSIDSESIGSNDQESNSYFWPTPVCHDIVFLAG